MSVLEVREMNGESQKDIDDLFRLYQATPEYFQIVKGRNPEFRDAVEALTTVPPGGGFKKMFAGYGLAGELVGCSDIVLGYPDEFTAYLGLLLFREDMQSKGYGSYAHSSLCEAAASKGYQRMRLSIIETNARAAQFWANKSYRKVAIQRSKSYPGKIVILEREL